MFFKARTTSLKATPYLISVTGQYDFDYRIIAATREGFICMLRRGWLEGKTVFRIEKPVVGISVLPIDQCSIIVCVGKFLECYSRKGKRMWGLNLSESVICMKLINLKHFGQTLICIALRGGLVQIYSNKVIVDQFTVSETVSAIEFGRLGQEDHVLVLITVGEDSE